MLTGHIENLLLPGTRKYPLDAVKLRGLRRVTDIARVNDELRRMGKRVDFVHGRLQSGGNIRIRGLVESDMTVADLDEIQFAFGAARRVLTEGLGGEYSAADRPDDTCAGPGHALEKTASIDAVVVVVVKNDS